MKYLIIQASASAILVLTALYPRHTKILFLFSLGPALALLVKAGAAPMHQWFIGVSKQLRWALAATLFTWQKLAPLYLLSFQIKPGMLVFIALSGVTGAVSIINKKALKEIMAWSSVFNLSWMLFSLLLRTKVFLAFISLYWISVAYALYLFRNSRGNRINELKPASNKWTTLLVIINLAGLPPFLGFLAKWLSFSEGLKAKLYLGATFLLVISSINLYVYLRTVRKNVIKSSWETQKATKSQDKMFLTLFLIINGFALVTLAA